ncbi:hypothetical protein [Pedobacter mucosus]|uniref:hypothetical protein n=1 Tax=Pedobacter mucosus TaxID=2895286 RepID=UPI001EE484DC|nr:hypothetical protein [Pedobacter mucosus]UKT65009.1 hypothetical protein LOK61_04345 [Pedobacter mucosus]
MKNLKLIQLFGIMLIAMAFACAPKYFGKTYSATQNVDIYMDAADVKKPYTTMGSSSFDEGFKGLDATQQKVIEMGRQQGADGVIMKLTEEVIATNSSGTTVVTKKTKNDIITGGSTTTNVKKNKITATFIKYN